MNRDSNQNTGGDRSWTGDVPTMRRSLETRDVLGWQPASESDSGTTGEAGTDR
uniref:hypothetical protein n=1 Tax=Natronococcus pandeyae TaxID=2055836 RepID=UPI001652DCC9|nr:hypothetical protein [Natronococcus pandeyae]